MSTTTSSYEMFTAEGNRLVGEMVEKVLSMPLSTTDREVYAHLQEAMNIIAALGHGEVWDTAVREAVIGRLERKMQRNLTIYF
jgi:hypothetical protein